MKNQNTEPTYEQLAEELITSEGSIVEAINNVITGLTNLQQNGGLTENVCKRAVLLMDDLTDRLTDEEHSKMKTSIMDLFENNTLYTSMYSLRTVLGIVYAASTENSGEHDKDLFWRSLAYMRKHYSWKQIKHMVNEHLDVSERKLYSKLVSEVRDWVDFVNAADKGTAEIAKTIGDSESKPWTEEQAKEETVKLMSFATEMLFRDGYVENTIYLHKGDSVAVLPIRYDNDDDKRRVLTMVKMLVRKVKPDALLHVGEAWFSKGKTKDELKVRPSQDPNRGESVIVSVQTPEVVYSMFQSFERDENNKPVLGETPEIRKETEEEIKSAYYRFDLGSSKSMSAGETLQ
jgi:hypothetical protein